MQFSIQYSHSNSNTPNPDISLTLNSVILQGLYNEHLLYVLFSYLGSVVRITLKFAYGEPIAMYSSNTLLKFLHNLW